MTEKKKLKIFKIMAKTLTHLIPWILDGRKLYTILYTRIKTQKIKEIIIKNILFLGPSLFTTIKSFLITQGTQFYYL